MCGPGGVFVVTIYVFCSCSVVTMSTYDELRSVFENFTLYNGSMRAGSDRYDVTTWTV